MLPCQQSETFAMIRSSLDRIEGRFDKQDEKLEGMDKKINDLNIYRIKLIGFSTGISFVIGICWTAYSAWAR